MVYRRLGPWSLALIVLIGIGSSTSRASGINFTGNVETDFPKSDESTQIVPVNANPNDIGQSQWITDNKWVSGWSVKDIRFSWDQKNDVLYVGINNWANPNGVIAPFGQANGNPAGTPETYDPSHLGYGNANSDKSVAVMFSRTDPVNVDQPGSPVMIAGVPADKSKNGPGTDGFNISTVDTTRSDSGLGYMFGKSLMGTTSDSLTGNLAYDPSPAHPQLEFAIKNFSKVFDPTKPFWIEMYAGSGIDGVAGESHISYKVPRLAPQETPEPTTILAWALMSGGIAWRVRSKKRAKV
ncbi:MAG: hypothetical protein P4L85_00815 [Paludisphaera borealis]|uniref:hypothetical protein n=1 Tax=Paludisphaera borealis TaxID=1387353 RepID=UPI002847CD76|nr:hypothetical protein [Paludisphaera borealis]MDR3617862.1 hypothetical protein [Paludisphaera borealis]